MNEEPDNNAFPSARSDAKNPMPVHRCLRPSRASIICILFLFLVYREIERGPEGPITVVPHAGGMQPEEN